MSRVTFNTSVRARLGKDCAEALRPFVSLLQSHHASKKDSDGIFGINDALLTAGDLRRAKAVLEEWDNNIKAENGHVV